MDLLQPELIKAPTPEERIRENLERAMFQFKGDVQAYYTELLKKLPKPARNPELDHLKRLAALRLRASR